VGEELRRVELRDLRPSVLETVVVKHGETPLDTVKDWVLAWDDPGDTPPFPRVLLTPERLAALRKTHGNDPQYALFFDPKEQKKQFGWACPNLTDAQRRRARTLAAFYAYKQSSPDYWPVNEYANGPSNPNMIDINACALSVTTSILRGHPEWKNWTELVSRVAQASYRASVSDDGVWYESPGYQWAGNTAANLSLLTLARHGVLDINSLPQAAKVNTYVAHLLSPPDPRFRGVRPGVTLPEGMKIPNFAEHYTRQFGLTEAQLRQYSYKKRMPAALGDNMPFHAAFQAWIAGSIKDKFPIEAGHGMWAWRQMGRPGIFGDVNVSRAAVDETVKSIPIDGKTKFFPGFGVMFRHGFDTPDETFVTFRWTDHAFGHYHRDFGSFSLYAKGVPLCLDWMYHSFNGSEYHNNMTPGGQSWGETKLREFASKPGADYARGKQPIRVSAPKAGDWQRQVLFVKDEADPGDKTYVVVRDVFQSKEKNTCNVWTMSAEPPRFEGDSIAHLKGQFDVDAHIIFFRKPPAPLTTRVAVHKKNVYWYDMRQTQHRVQASADSAADYGYIIYATKPGQKPPTVTVAEGGVLRLRFADGVEHVLFLFPETKSVTLDRLSFAGRCGVAKKKAGKWALTLLSGDALRQTPIGN